MSVVPRNRNLLRTDGRVVVRRTVPHVRGLATVIGHDLIKERRVILVDV